MEEAINWRYKNCLPFVGLVLLLECDDVMRTGSTNLPLHGGSAPRWLFERMVKLSREIISLMVYELGAEAVLTRLSDPYWFQSLGCVLGFDWHSSGLTTTTCGAIKEGIKGLESELGIFACGGKGAASRKTPVEIASYADRYSLDGDRLVYASRMSAKVDSAAVQDGYTLYHHMFFFDNEGRWAVVQQGMHDTNGWARRYHWLSIKVEDFVCEPHAAICSSHLGESLLNMVAEEADDSRKVSSSLACEKPEIIVRDLKHAAELSLPARHAVMLSDIHPDRLYRALLNTYERCPKNFEELLGTPGIGAKSIRSLALIADLVYGAPICVRDPALFSFAHGGKDGTPYPVDRKVYDKSIDVIRRAVEQAKLGSSETTAALQRLSRYYAL